MAPALSAGKNSVVLLLQGLKELQPQTLPPLILMKQQEVLLLHLLLLILKELEITLKGGLQSLLVALEDSQDLFSLHLTRCSPLLGQAAAQEVVRAADQRVDHRQTRTTKLLLPNPAAEVRQGQVPPQTVAKAPLPNLRPGVHLRAMRTREPPPPGVPGSTQNLLTSILTDLWFCEKGYLLD